MNIIKKSFLVASFFTLGFFVLAPEPVQTLGAEISNQTGAFAGERGAQIGNTARDPRAVAASVINLLLGLLGTLFIVYTIYGGFLIMTAAGEEDKINKGKSTLRTAIIGVIVISISYSISLYVTNAFIFAQQRPPGLFIRGGIDFGNPGRVRGSGPDITNTSPFRAGINEVDGGFINN